MYQKSKQKFTQVGSLVPKQVLRQASMENVTDSKEKIVDCGLTTCGTWGLDGQHGSLLKILEASKNGKVKFRAAWRGLATEFPDWRSRLLISACLISDGAISMLPTVTARDWRSPGRPDHPRLIGQRGLPLPEDLGSQLHPELAECLMGFPIGWTELEHVETQ